MNKKKLIPGILCVLLIFTLALGSALCAYAADDDLAFVEEAFGKLGKGDAKYMIDALGANQVFWDNLTNDAALKTRIKTKSLELEQVSEDVIHYSCLIISPTSLAKTLGLVGANPKMKDAIPVEGYLRLTYLDDMSRVIVISGEEANPFTLWTIISHSRDAWRLSQVYNGQDAQANRFQKAMEIVIQAYNPFFLQQGLPTITQDDIDAGKAEIKADTAKGLWIFFIVIGAILLVIILVAIVKHAGEKAEQKRRRQKSEEAKREKEAKQAEALSLAVTKGELPSGLKLGQVQFTFDNEINIDVTYHNLLRNDNADETSLAWSLDYGLQKDLKSDYISTAYFRLAKKVAERTQVADTVNQAFSQLQGLQETASWKGTVARGDGFAALLRFAMNDHSEPAGAVLVALLPAVEKQAAQKNVLAFQARCILHQRMHHGFGFDNRDIDKAVQDSPMLVSKRDYENSHKRLDKEPYEEIDKETLELVQLSLHPQPNRVQELTDALAGELTRRDDDPNSPWTTRAGWRVVALARCCTQNLTDKTFNVAKEMHGKLIDQHNADVERLRTAHAKREAENAKEIPNNELINIYNDQIKEIEERLRKGIIGRCSEAKCNPIQELLGIACDSQNRHGRYIAQCAIMGVLPFLLARQNNPLYSDYFQAVLRVRASMICEDKDYSFFEVRAPRNCNAEQYAEILQEVLSCANPSLKYTDTKALVRRVEQEVPGALTMLCDYPLRLIDPANQQAKGFYRFKPYHHMLWYSYTPPEGQGQVHRRYHEVVDMTVPNSVGLQLSLFTDPYLAIPTLYHEYCHYEGDHNEANVWLRTHLFSGAFYQKFRTTQPKVNPQADFEYSHLRVLLEEPPKLDKCEALNNLILECYGEQIDEEKAQAMANEEIAKINRTVLHMNMRQTWCNDIRWPILFEKKERISKWETTKWAETYGEGAPLVECGNMFGVDTYTCNALSRIIHDYYTAPRTITPAEFYADLLEFGKTA